MVAAVRLAVADLPTFAILFKRPLWMYAGMGYSENVHQPVEYNDNRHTEDIQSHGGVF